MSRVESCNCDLIFVRGDEMMEATGASFDASSKRDNQNTINTRFMNKTIRFNTVNHGHGRGFLRENICLSLLIYACTSFN